MKKIFLLLLFNIISFANLKNDVKVAHKYLIESNNKKLIALYEKMVNTPTKDEEDIMIKFTTKYNLANIYLMNDINIDLAKKYFDELSNDENIDRQISFLSNQKLINIAIKENDLDKIIYNLEKINVKTNYLEIPFLSNLIYMYSVVNLEIKLKLLEKKILSNMNDDFLLKLYYNVSNLFLEKEDIENSKKFLKKISQLNTKYSEEYRDLSYAKIDFLNKNIYEGNKKLENILVKLENKNHNDNELLNELEILFFNIGNLEKAYEITLKKYNNDKKNPETLVNLIREMNYLNKKDEINKYLLELEKLRYSDWEIALMLRGSDLVDYAKIYLLKAANKNDLRALNALLDIYFNTMDEKFIELVDKTDLIALKEKNNLKKQFYQFIEYNKKGKK